MTATRSPRVLIVDDDSDIRETIEEILIDHGFAATGADNGAAALAQLRSAPHDPPCLILLDMMMPVMDGRAFREVQHADPALSAIPVVVLTAHAAGERSACELQVDGFLKKPVDLDKLLDTVERYCERRRAALRDE